METQGVECRIHRMGAIILGVSITAAIVDWVPAWITAHTAYHAARWRGRVAYFSLHAVEPVSPVRWHCRWFCIASERSTWVWR